VAEADDDAGTTAASELPLWLADESDDIDPENLDWRTVNARRSGSALRSLVTGRVDFPRLTYNDRYAVGPMSVYRGDWGDADIVHTRVLLDQVVRVSVCPDVLPPWDFGPVSGDAIVLELVDGDCCAPLALVDARRDVAASWVFLDTLIQLGIPVDEDVEGLLDAPVMTSADGVVLTTWTDEADAEPLWSLTDDVEGEERRRGGKARLWAPILAEPAVTEPRLAVPPVGAAPPEAPQIDEAWGFVQAHDGRSLWQRWAGTVESPKPLVYSTRRVVGEMAWTSGGWSAAVMSSREVLLDDVERVTVEPGVLHLVDRWTPQGDLLPLGTTGGDAVVLVLVSGERCAPLALAHDGRDVDETAAFVAVLDQLAIPVDPAVRRLLAP
jgi:hypothetical protein